VRIVNIGYGNVVAADRIIAVVSPDSAPMKRLKEDARGAGKLVDATQGRRTRSIIVTDSDHVILSALQSETLAERLVKDSLPGDDLHAHE
jgi:extracellular matrix regulatory protein A